MAIGPDGNVIIQHKIDRLKKWADRNLGKFRKEDFKVLHLWKNIVRKDVWNCEEQFHVTMCWGSPS